MKKWGSGRAVVYSCNDVDEYLIKDILAGTKNKDCQISISVTTKNSDSKSWELMLSLNKLKRVSYAKMVGSEKVNVLLDFKNKEYQFDSNYFYMTDSEARAVYMYFSGNEYITSFRDSIYNLRKRLLDRNAFSELIHPEQITDLTFEY